MAPPDRAASAARRARDRVLDRAEARGLIGPEEARAARAEPVPSARRPFPMLAAHAAEAALAAQPSVPVHRLTLDAAWQANLQDLVRAWVARLGPGCRRAWS
jgi:penicillin-binding protein 1C